MGVHDAVARGVASAVLRARKGPVAVIGALAFLGACTLTRHNINGSNRSLPEC